MILARSQSRRRRARGRCVYSGATLLLLTACFLFSAHWDRKAAQTALVQARKLRDLLADSPSPSQEKYIRCIRTYQEVYLKDPHFGGSDDAIYEAGVLYQEMAEKFGTLLYYRNAAKLFRFLIRDYGGSPRCPDALLRLGDLCAGPLEDEQGAQEAYDKLRTKYKSSKAAAALTLKKRVPDAIPTESKQAAIQTSSQEITNGAALVENIRHWSTSDYTRVIIDMDIQTRYAKTRLTNPDRIYFDISNAKVSRDLQNKTFMVADAFLKQVRVGQNRQDVVRVVLDFASIGDYAVFELHDPFRIVVDIHGTRGNTGIAEEIAQKTETSKEQRTKPAPAVIDPAEEKRVAALSYPVVQEARPPVVAEKSADAKSVFDKPPLKAVKRGESKPGLEKAKPIEVKPSGEKASTKSGRDTEARPGADKPGLEVQELPTAVPPAPHGVEPAPTPGRSETAKATKAARPVPPPAASAESLPPPKAAAPTSRGDRTLTRMLGLKIGRIVLDPGHGGHDTGTIGRGGLLEKDLVLQVAHELKQLLEDKLSAEVILTREDDKFISLEERTAIANQSRADLFISIHANSSRSRVVSGVETYYLNFARSEAEREVAARENATSVRNISDLQNLIKRIAQADKSTESRELAAILQNKLYGSARQLFPTARNRGVRSAPFVVLIGANMPSVLAEVAFISNPRDEKVLRQDNNRQRLAQALFAGIEGYMKTLGSDVAQTHVGGN